MMRSQDPKFPLHYCTLVDTATMGMEAVDTVSHDGRLYFGFHSDFVQIKKLHLVSYIIIVDVMVSI
jgi:hypothetical protein